MTFDFADVIPFHDSLHEISAQEFPEDDSWTLDYHPGNDQEYFSSSGQL